MNSKTAKKISILSLLVTLGVAFTSCLSDNDDSISQGELYTFATILKEGSDYRFLLDNKSEAHLSGYESKALDGWRRAYIHFTYYQTDVKSNGDFSNGTITEAYQLGVHDILTKKEADEQNITASDSIYDISGYTYWIVNGYFTYLYNTPYVYSNRPTVNLYYDENEQKADTLTLHALVNRHSKAVPAGETQLYESFRLEPLFEQYETLDSLVIKVYGSPDTEPASVKISTKSMLEPETQGL